MLGELKNNSDYNSKTIYLHKDLFKTNSFGRVFSTFLHELSHANGNGDGSREFSDMLTLLLENSIDKNGTVTLANSSEEVSLDDQYDLGFLTTHFNIYSQEGDIKYAFIRYCLI